MESEVTICMFPNLDFGEKQLSMFCWAGTPICICVVYLFWYLFCYNIFLCATFNVLLGGDSNWRGNAISKAGM